MARRVASVDEMAAKRQRAKVVDRLIPYQAGIAVERICEAKGRVRVAFTGPIAAKICEALDRVEADIQAAGRRREDWADDSDCTAGVRVRWN